MEAKIKHLTGSYVLLHDVDADDVVYHFKRKNRKSMLMDDIIKDFAHADATAITTIITTLVEAGTVQLLDGIVTLL